ncbi:DUF563 domain-containing protein [Paracoccus sp. JM45]|uniref:glycosyltransferase family 61 protein n=1 Tax=Paracoccus sp. JM45 TaxID=2283626 RepID=UPI000E6BDD3B|nr:glycosyltransferase family 61 protein [Paracoccus sp. JM45]RJE81260.1 glycosyltransferase family 61 protein [Paracoccus sp. JM45]
METEYSNILDDFDPIKMTAAVGEFLYQGKIDTSFAMLNEVVALGLLPEKNRRVTNGRMRIKSVAKHIACVEKISQNEPSLEKITAKVFIPGEPRLMPRHLSADMPAGQYESSALSSLARNQVNLSEHCAVEDLPLLKKFGFERQLNELQTDRLFVGKNCRFSYLADDAMTALIDEEYVIPALSGRVAKSTSIGIYKKTDHILGEALVLPFPHKVGNFYHALSEMVYGLRYARNLSSDIPIIHGEDKFKLLPVICKLIGIDEQRLIQVSECASLKVSTAYMPSTPSFYWNTPFVQFFRKAALRNLKPDIGQSRIYISRSRSARSTPGEADFELYLQKIGYKIIHAQDLTFEGQIKLFMGATKIIAPHGAGLTNMVFCRDEVRIVEVFSSNMLQPDFYQRSKFVNKDYQCVIIDDYNQRNKLADYI